MKNNPYINKKLAIAFKCFIVLIGITVIGVMVKAKLDGKEVNISKYHYHKTNSK